MNAGAGEADIVRQLQMGRPTIERCQSLGYKVLLIVSWMNSDSCNNQSSTEVIDADNIAAFTQVYEHSMDHQARLTQALVDIACPTIFLNGGTHADWNLDRHFSILTASNRLRHIADMVEFNKRCYANKRSDTVAAILRCSGSALFERLERARPNDAWHFKSTNQNFEEILKFVDACVRIMYIIFPDAWAPRQCFRAPECPVCTMDDMNPEILAYFSLSLIHI